MAKSKQEIIDGVKKKLTAMKRQRTAERAEQARLADKGKGGDNGDIFSEDELDAMERAADRRIQ